MLFTWLLLVPLSLLLLLRRRRMLPVSFLLYYLEVSRRLEFGMHIDTTLLRGFWSSESLQKLSKVDLLSLILLLLLLPIMLARLWLSRELLPQQLCSILLLLRTSPSTLQAFLMHEG